MFEIMKAHFGYVYILGFRSLIRKVLSIYVYDCTFMSFSFLFVFILRFYVKGTEQPLMCTFGDIYLSAKQKG